MLCATRIVEVFYGAADGHAVALRADGRMMEWGGTAASARITNVGLPLGLSAGLAAPDAGVTVVAGGGDVIAIDGGRGAQVFGSARALLHGRVVCAEGGAFVLATHEGRLEVWRGDGSLAFAFEAHPGRGHGMSCGIRAGSSSASAATALLSGARTASSGLAPPVPVRCSSAPVRCAGRRAGRRRRSPFPAATRPVSVSPAMATRRFPSPMNWAPDRAHRSSH